MAKPLSFSRFLEFPENQAALRAVTDLADAFRNGKASRSAHLIVLHGPEGTGKTHLVSALEADVIHSCPWITVSRHTAEELSPVQVRCVAGLFGPIADELSQSHLLQELRDSDLAIVEDIQHLRPSLAESLTQVVDERLARRRPLVVTARCGPRLLAHRAQAFPARLTSRLASGLVVGLEPWQFASRLRFLEECAQRRQLAVGRDILAWLAEHLIGGGRQLTGALHQLESLVRFEHGPLALAVVAAQFHDHQDAVRPTVERIAQQVGACFQVELKQLQSRRRYRGIVLPRQVGMFLARNLTKLSLDQIGAYFGGRDHSTVLHACRKVEQAMSRDLTLAGAVRRLRAELA